MALPLDPYSCIGSIKKAFDPGCFWMIIDYDPETGEHIAVLCRREDSCALHPFMPEKIPLKHAPTKRIRL